YSSYLYCSVAVVFLLALFFFFFSSRRRHTRCYRDWSSDVCSSDLGVGLDGDPAGVEGDPLADQHRTSRPGRGGPVGGDDQPRRRSEERRVGKEWRGRWWAGS